MNEKKRSVSGLGPSQNKSGAAFVKLNEADDRRYYTRSENERKRERKRKRTGEKAGKNNLSFYIVSRPLFRVW